MAVLGDVAGGEGVPKPSTSLVVLAKVVVEELEAPMPLGALEDMAHHSIYLPFRNGLRECDGVDRCTALESAPESPVKTHYR